MEQLDLLSSPSSLPGGAETLTHKMAAFLRQHEGEWLDILPLARVGGMGGWRTEISRCRTRFGMVIEQRMEHWDDGRNRSQYRYRRASEQGKAA
jgi:hypothetical protein